MVCPKLEKFRKYIDVGGAEKYEYPKDLLEPLKSQDSALLAEMIGNGLTGQKKHCFVERKEPEITFRPYYHSVLQRYLSAFLQ